MEKNVLMKSIKVNSKKVYINMYNLSVFLIINYCFELDSVTIAGGAVR